MRNAQDYSRPCAITSGKDILNVCRNQNVIRYVIPQGWEMLLPRVRLEKIENLSGGKGAKKYLWFAEAWWTNADGILRYYVKINLETGMVKEFRELPGDASIFRECDSAAEVHYLDRCAETMHTGPENLEAAETLDQLWQAAVPRELRKLALKPQKEQTLGSYLLPLESLTDWNWGKLKELLLRRENTTVESILDYIAYKKSGSGKRYIAPEHRAEAKARGVKFGGNEDDV